MGNRAVINQYGSNEAVYLHWNGGRDSVEPLLYYAKHFASKYVGFEHMKALDVFAFVCDCVGLNPIKTTMGRADCDNGDNGVYYIDDDYKITGRAFNHSAEQKYNNFEEMLNAIDQQMPTKKQLSKTLLDVQIDIIKSLETSSAQ